MGIKTEQQSELVDAKYEELKSVLPTNLNEICLGVANSNGLDYVITFHAADRHQEYAILRQYCSWLACCQGMMSLKQIGKIMNRQDHATIIHSRNTVRNLFDANDGRINEVHRNYVNYLKGPECIYDFKEFTQQSF